MSDLVTVSEGARKGTALSNLYINIGGQSTSSLTGEQIDEKLSKTDQLLLLEEEISRDVNPSSINNLFSAGEMVASYARAKILRTKSSIYVQKMLFAGQNIATITVYRADIINGKLTITEEILYSNCTITKIKSSAGEKDFNNPESASQEGLDTLDFSFRFLARQNTAYFFDQEGTSKGQDVSLLNFPAGTLQPAAAEGGAGAEGGAEGEGGGGAGAGGETPAAEGEG